MCDLLVSLIIKVKEHIAMGKRCTEDAIIGANIKRFRQKYNFTRKELANIFHISEDGMYRIERGETGLSSAYGYILANELHCDMNFIYGITKEPKLIYREEDESRMSLENIAERLRIYASVLDNQIER